MSSNRVVATIHGFGNPTSISANLNTPFVYLSDLTTGRLTAIDAPTNTAKTIDLNCPSSLTMRSNQQSAYDVFSCGGSGYQQIDTSNNHVENYSKANFVDDSSNVLFALPGRRTLYTVNFGNGNIVAYDELTAQVLSSTPLEGSGTATFAANNTGSLLYAASGGVYQLATSTNRIVGRLPLPASYDVAQISH